MKKTLAILCLTVAAAVSGCNLCPIDGFNNVGTIQTSYFQLDKKLRANTPTFVGEYTYLQDVNLPPGQAFINAAYASDSIKKRKSEFCFLIEYFRRNTLLFNKEECATIKKARGAEIYIPYTVGFSIEQGDTLRMSFRSSKNLIKDTGLEVTAGYQIFAETPGG